MAPSRKLSDLLPIVERAARAHDAFMLAEGIELITTCSYRSYEEQAELFARGRTKPGAVVTQADAGRSPHQYRVARDVVPVVGGKAVWDDWELWERIGETGEALGFEWGGRWEAFRDAPHFQLTADMTIGELSALSPEETDERIERWYERTGLSKTLAVAGTNMDIIVPEGIEYSSRENSGIARGRS
ncbi:MAG: M15 family metallopeptidase [Candidatus Nitrospinota bacterium M3_3B_026]